MVSPSSEQLEIIEAVRQGHNVLGDCVAGSGKTTTVLMIAKEFPDKNIVLLTYNSALKLEVREKVENELLTNIQSHSYHSANGTYYAHHSKTSNYDDAIRCVIKHRRPLRTPSLAVDILIIDETQDMKKLFFHFCWKFYTDLTKKPQIVVLGDRFQGLYSFVGSDTRYLTRASELWKQPFVDKTLSTSYRVTHQIASFVNEVLLGYTRINAVRDGPPVSYWRTHPFNDTPYLLYKFIKDQLEKGYNPGDIFILSPSINGSAMSPVRKVENILAMNKIPCYYPTTDDAVLDKDVIQNKVVFSSFHSSKGRERKIVVVLGFEASYFKFGGRGLPETVCPDAIYVAVTRAKEKLVVIQSSLDTPLPFLFKTRSQLSSLPYMEMTPTVSETFKDQTIPKCRNTTPTDLVRFVTDENLLLLKNLVEPSITIIEEASMSVGVELKIKTSTGSEDVSAINGIVIPMIQEYRRTGKKSTVQKVVEGTKSCLREHREQPFLRKYLEKWDPATVDIRSDIYLAVLFTACTSQLYHKLTQIDRHNWLTYDQIQPCIDILDRFTSTSTGLCYEHPLIADILSPTHGRISMEGRIDICDDETIWEVKCVENLTFDHELQLVVYAWMWKQVYSDTRPRMFKLINVRSGEIRQLGTDIDLDAIMRVLLDNKYLPKKWLCDSEFFSSLSNVYDYTPDEPVYADDEPDWDDPED
jgi:AAA domain